MGLTLGLNQFTELEEVADLNAGVEDGDNKVTNKEKTKSTNVQIFVGHEHRRGNTRVQGFCGADLYTGIGSNSTVNSYGNDDNDLAAGPHEIKRKSGLAFNIGARAFVGAEYFIAPKLALGFEAGLALGYDSQAAGEIEQLTVTRVGASTTTETNTIEGTSSTRNIGLNNNLTGGRVSLTFHF